MKGKKLGQNYINSMYYIENNIIISTNVLKKKLFRDNIKEKKCEKCNNTTWNKLDIPLELHHIDSNRYNNKLNNLIILCPNCHTQKHNKSNNKNIINNNREFNYKNDTLGDINHTKFLYERYNTIKVEKEKVKKYIPCCGCGNKIIKNKTSMCKICYKKSIRKIERPSLEQLNIDVKELGYSGTGRKYGVSDNCIRKWIKF